MEERFVGSQEDCPQMIQQPRRRIARLSTVLAVAVLAAAAGRRARPSRPIPSCSASGRRRISTHEPVEHRARVRATRRSSSPTTCSPSSTRTPSPAPGFADTWERAADRVTFHIRDGMKWSRTGRRRRRRTCASAGASRSPRSRTRRPSATATSNPGLKDAGVTKIECPDDSTFIAYTTDQSDRIFQVYVPILPKHVCGKFDYKKIAEEKFDAAARRHRSVHARRVEDRPVRAVRPQPATTGASRASPTRSSCGSSRRRRHDGPGAEGGRARLRPQRQRGPVQAAARPTRRTRRSRARRTAGPSSRSTPTGPAPARRSRTAGRRPRRCSTRRSATPSATPSTKQALVDRVLGGFGDVGTTIVPPVLSDWHVEPDNPRTLRHRARQAEARRGRLRPRTATASASTRRASRSRCASYYPNTDDVYAKSAQFVQEWYGQLGIDVTLQSFDSDTLDQPGPAARGRRQGELRHRAVGLGRQPGPERPARSIFRCDQIGTSSDSQYCNPDYDALYDKQLEGGRRRAPRDARRRCRT